MDLAAVDLLRSRGLRVTAQRLAVLQAVTARPHSTADALAEAVRAEVGAISLQAVYDALSVLEDADLVRRIQPTGSATLFETRTGDNHHHLVCRTCGAVADADCAVGERPCLTAAQSHGYRIDEAEVIYWGYCPSCIAEPTATPGEEDHVR